MSAQSTGEQAAPRGIRQVTIQSNNLTFAQEAQEGDIVEQRLVITAAGHVRFSAFGYTHGTIQLARAQQARIGADAGHRILGAIASYLAHGEPSRAVAAGTWEMQVRYDDGSEGHFEGPLVGAVNAGSISLSQMIRDLVPIPHLIVFGGR